MRPAVGSEIAQNARGWGGRKQGTQDKCRGSAEKGQVMLLRRRVRDASTLSEKVFDDGRLEGVELSNPLGKRVEEKEEDNTGRKTDFTVVATHRIPNNRPAERSN